MELLIVPVAAVIIIYCIEVARYKRTTYYHDTKQPYLKVRYDAGLLGEYLTFKKLKSFEKSGARFLFNCYLPKEDGETTEVDLMLVSRSGIYVFESKNYSGWIFGRENARMWTQTLPRGKGRRAHKEQFLNPVFQNKLHIKSLQQVIGDRAPVHSVIVFSERCTLKNVDVKEANVVQRFDVRQKVKSIGEKYGEPLSADEVETLYQNLYPYTQVSEQTKIDHVAAINKGLEGKQPDEKRPVLMPEPVKTAETAAEIAAETEPLAEIPADRLDNGIKHICPKCGSEMILRTAKRGQNKGMKFYGCSNYPKCRAIQTIEEKSGMENGKDDTLQYYNNAAAQFVETTRDVVFTDTQERFLKFLEPGARILDFGCGSGRDTKYFINRGFHADAVDGSEELVKLAAGYTGIEVKQMLFQELDADGEYEGIWACASILHLNRDELTDVFRRIERALISQGILYVSFKYGEEDTVRNGRYFTDMTEEKMKSFPVIDELFEAVEVWKTVDVRPGRETEEWLNLILRKKK